MVRVRERGREGERESVCARQKETKRKSKMILYVGRCVIYCKEFFSERVISTIATNVFDVPLMRTPVNMSLKKEKERNHSFFRSLFLAEDE